LRKLLCGNASAVVKRKTWGAFTSTIYHVLWQQAKPMLLFLLGLW
jgi:hypothetical protein